MTHKTNISELEYNTDKKQTLHNYIIVKTKKQNLFL